MVSKCQQSSLAHRHQISILLNPSQDSLYSTKTELRQNFTLSGSIANANIYIFSGYMNESTLVQHTQTHTSEMLKAQGGSQMGFGFGLI